MTIVNTSITYLLGTVDATRTPTRDITKFIKNATTGRTVSASSEIKLRVNNPNGIFTDSSRSDYIYSEMDYVLLIQVAGRNVWRGVLISKETQDDTNGSVVTLAFLTDGEFMRRVLVTGTYSPVDWAYVEDVIEDLFKTANPDPWAYYGLRYRLQNGYHEDFDDITDGTTPTDWTEADALGDFQVKEYLYDGTTPLYISEPKSVRLRNTANNQHQVYLDKLYLEGNRILISARIYYDSALGNFDFLMRLSDEDNIQLCYCQMKKSGSNVTMYLTDGATARTIWGPAGPSSNWFTFKFVVNLDTDTYDFYWGNTGQPNRYGSNAGHTALDQWDGTYNNSLDLTNTGKNAVDRVTFFLDDDASGAQRTLYVDDFYALESEPVLRHALTSEVRFSSEPLYGAVTRLCAMYNLEWRDLPAKFFTDRAFVETYRVDPATTATITASESSDISQTSVKESSNQYKNFFIVKGKDDILGMAADVDSINQHGYFPMRKSDTRAESIRDTEEFAEALKTKYNRNSTKATLSVTGEEAGYEEVLQLKPGDNIDVTQTRAGLGTTETYVIEKIICTIDESLQARIQVGDIWKSASYIAYEAMRNKDQADEEKPTDIMHLRYLAAKVTMSGDWAFVGSTNAPAIVSTSGITDFGKKAIREMQISDDLADDYTSNYYERPKRFRLIDNAGAVYENSGGLIAIDRWGISAIGTDGSGDKYCELEFSNSSALTISAYFTWARTELVSLRQYIVTETLGTSDSVLELNSVEGLRVNDQLVITNAAGTSVTVNVAEVMGNKVQIYGTHAVIQPKGSICECYSNVICGMDHDVKHQPVSNDIEVQMTLRFTNEETPTVQGQITEDGLTKFCQRVRATHELGVLTMDGLNLAQRFYVGSTTNLMVGDYVTLKTAAGQVELATVTAINAGNYFDTYETFTPSDYGVADTVRIISFPWSYVSYGEDDTARASNYYNSKRRLDGEFARASLQSMAPLMSNAIKATVTVPGSLMPPAMANTMLDGIHTTTTALKVISTDGMHPGQVVYVGTTRPYSVAGLNRATITTVDSATQLTVSNNITASDSDPVITGFRREENESSTIYEIAITDRQGDIEESDVCYFLGAFLSNDAEVDYGFGAYQYDEYTDRDSVNSEWNLKGDGSSTSPTDYFCKTLTDGELVTSVTGMGVSMRPVTKAWTVNIRENPLTHKNGRYPALDEVLTSGVDLGIEFLNKIDKVGNDPDQWYANSGELSYTRLKNRKTPSGFNLESISHKLTRRWDTTLHDAHTAYNEKQWYKGVALEFDARGATHIDNVHPDKLTLALYGHGHSWDSAADNWKNGIYAFIWLSGTRDTSGTAVPSMLTKEVMPHWEYITLLNSSGVDVDSTSIASDLVIGSLGGGNVVPNIGNRINQAIQPNGKIYVLLIPRRIDRLQKSSYVWLDYVALGIGASPMGGESKVRTFRMGIDYLWSKDWNYILWPGATPTNKVTETSELLGPGGVFCWVDNSEPFTVGEVIYISSDPYVITSMGAGHYLGISPPAVRSYAINTAVKKSHFDWSTNIEAGNRNYHPMPPMPTTNIFAGSGTGYRTKITKDTTTTTVKVKDSSGFETGDDVMIFDRYTMTKEWNTISAIVSKREITLGIIPVSTIEKNSMIGRVTIPFDLTTDATITPQSVIESYESIIVNAGRNNSFGPPGSKDDLATGWDEADIPDVVVDWIDETNGKIYLGVLYPFIEPQAIISDTIAAIGSNRIYIDITTGNLDHDAFKGGRVEITDTYGVVHVYTIRHHTPSNFTLYEPVHADIAVNDVFDITPEMGVSFVDAYERFWCTSFSGIAPGDEQTPKIVYHDPRIMIDATGGAAPIVTDWVQEETIAATTDMIRVIRNSDLHLELHPTSVNGVIFKAGGAKDETTYPIRNDNLVAEEQETLINGYDETSIKINCKHFTNFITNDTTGRVRIVVDIVDNTSFPGSTVLTANAYIGDTALTVNTTAGFAAGQVILLVDGTTKELCQVVSIAGGVTINLVEPIRKVFKFATAAVNRTLYQKVVLDVINPYGPFKKKTPIHAVLPQRIGAVYKVSYEKEAGKVLARAQLTDADISRPVLMKRDEQLKSGIELMFTWDD